MPRHTLPTCFLALLLAAPGAAWAQRDTFEQRVELAAGGNLSLDISGGSVLLLAWEEPAVEIRARIEAPASVDGDYARNIVAATRVDVRATAGAVSISNDFSAVERRGFFDRRRTFPDVHYEIRAPREINLDISLERGAGTTLRGFEGQVAITSERSDLNLVELSGGLRIALTQGQLQVSDFTGSLALTVARGERAVLTRTSGSLLVQADETNVVLRAARIDGDSDVTINRGDFDLELAERQPLTIEADLTARATIDSEQLVILEQTDDRYQGTLDGGGPALRIRADRGEVRLRAN